MTREMRNRRTRTIEENVANEREEVLKSSRIHKQQPCFTRRLFQSFEHCNKPRSWRSDSMEFVLSSRARKLWQEQLQCKQTSGAEDKGLDWIQSLREGLASLCRQSEIRTLALFHARTPWLLKSQPNSQPVEQPQRSCTVSLGTICCLERQKKGRLPLHARSTRCKGVYIMINLFCMEDSGA